MSFSIKGSGKIIQISGSRIIFDVGKTYGVNVGDYFYSPAKTASVINPFTSKNLGEMVTSSSCKYIVDEVYEKFCLVSTGIFSRITIGDILILYAKPDFNIFQRFWRYVQYINAGQVHDSFSDRW